MPKIMIDGQAIEAAPDETILTAARRIGIEIPTLCFWDGCAAMTSCMVCVVRINGDSSLAPACAAKAVEGMEVESETPAIHDARRTALELILSEHLGDCMGPCSAVCPAHMNIPLMLRQIADKKFDEALITVKKHIPLPAVLGRICPAPCEKGCRRKVHDHPAAICQLKRFVADIDLGADRPWTPEKAAARGRQVAIIGSGPTGLTAAWYLLKKGYDCTIFDDHNKPGGGLQYSVGRDRLPRAVLDNEIEVIRRFGAEFQLGVRISAKSDLENLQSKFDAVLLAVGTCAAGQIEAMGLESAENGIKVNGAAMQTGIEGIFAAGNALRKGKMAIKSIGDGKNAAESIDQYLSGKKVTGLTKLFNNRAGKLQEGEILNYMTQADPYGGRRIAPDATECLTEDQAPQEAVRCMHCDCRKADNCRLRDACQEYLAKCNKYTGQRDSFRQIRSDVAGATLIFEPGKCIDCGLCAAISAAGKEEIGLAFKGRGFDAKITVPFDRPLSEALQKTARQCVKACPTAALAWK